MKVYSLDTTGKFINRYLEYKDATLETVQEGSLGYGIVVLTAPKRKTAIIKEVFLNAWSSGHTIRLYYKTPKKYLYI